MLLFHASNLDYSFPNYDDLKNNITNHPNGALGLWVATDDSWISSFGGNVYTIEIEDEHTTILPTSELFDWEKKYPHTDESDLSHHINYYSNKRQELLEAGYKCVLFKEYSGSIGMGVVLDFQYIKSFQLKTAQNLKNKIKP